MTKTGFTRDDYEMYLNKTKNTPLKKCGTLRRSLFPETFETGYQNYLKD